MPRLADEREHHLETGCMFPNLFRMDALQSDLAYSARAFLPELVLCCAIVLLLLLRLFKALDRWHLGWVSLAFTVCALCVSGEQWQEMPNNQLTALPIFTGLLTYDTFTVFLRLFLFSF